MSLPVLAMEAGMRHRHGTFDRMFDSIPRGVVYLLLEWRPVVTQVAARPEEQLHQGYLL